jgi:uncharacterized protein YggE
MRNFLITWLIITGITAFAAQDMTITIPDSFARAAKPTLEVSGRAEIKTAPDTVVLTPGIFSRNNKASRAFDDNQTKMANVLSKLELLGIPRSKVLTSSLSISPVYRQDNSGKVDYYTVSRYLRIVQDDLGNISPILDALVDAGVEDVGSIQFQVKNMEEKRKEAMESAAKDCRDRGETLAGLMGARITGIKSIRYDFGGYGYDNRNFMSNAPAMNLEENQMITPSSVSTEVNVYVTYEIEYVGR